MSGDLLKLRTGAVEWREIDGEVVALQLDRSEYVAVNRSGAALWSHLAEGTTRERLIERLQSEFGIDSSAAERDVDDFIDALRSQQLLETEEAG